MGAWASAVVLVAVCGLSWAASGTVTYYGAVPGEGKSGDVDDTTHFTDHADYWDYCYTVEYSNLVKGSAYWWSMYAPYQPVGWSGTAGSGATLSYCWENSMVKWSIQPASGPGGGGGGTVSGTAYMQFWSQWSPRSLTSKELGKTDNWTVTFGTEGRPNLYTNPEPSSLAFGALVLPFAALLRSRRGRRKEEED